jgi:hypothetical protein
LSSTRNRLAALAAVLCFSQAHGALPDEIQVYTDDVNAPGERGIELHVNTTPSGRSRPDYAGEVTPYHGLRITPELSWGLVPDVDWGLYLPFVRSGEGTDYFAGPRFRLKWMPLRGKPGYFAGVNGELSFVERKFEEARRTIEIRPIVGYRGKAWLASFNPQMSTDLAGPDKGVVTFHPSLKLSRDVGDRTALGFEYYADLGRLSHFAPSSEQSRTLYFVFDTETVNFGIGRGLNGATDRWTLKSIISF